MPTRNTCVLSAAALIVSIAAATPSFGQGYAYPAAGRFMDSPYYAGSSTYVGSRYHARARYVGSRYAASRYYAGSRYYGGSLAYGSVDGTLYSTPYRGYAYSGWYEPRQNSDPDPRIGGTFKISDHNNDD